MKWFLNHLFMMNVIPSFLRDGFPFDPFAGNWGAMLIDPDNPYEGGPEIPGRLMDAWGQDWTWLKYAFPFTIEWIPGGSDMYANPGHYEIGPWFKDFYCVDLGICLEGFSEPDFFEFLGFNFYDGWKKKGGVEIYFDQVVEQRNAVRDAIWNEYKTDLTGDRAPAPEDKDISIRLTNGIDNAFPNTDSKTSMHAQWLYDAVTDLVRTVGVRKLVINEYFMFFSQMMNDAMDRETVNKALTDLENEGDTGIQVTWAPDKRPIGEVTVPIYGCSQWPPYAIPLGKKQG